MKVPWDIFWESKPWSGKVGLLDDERDALSMPMQRDAMRAGRIPDLNTDDAGDHREGRQRPLAAHRHLQHQGRRSPTTRRCRRPRPGSTTRGRATCSAQSLYYLPKGTKPDVLSFWGPDTNGVVQNDLLWVVCEVEEAGARARVPELPARREERVRQLRAVQRLHAAAEHDRRRVAGQEGPDPEEPRARRSCGPTSSRTTRSCSRSASPAPSSGRTPGRSSRPAEWSPLDLARARRSLASSGSRSSSS